MFWLLPHEPPPVPQRGSPRMFRVAWMERHLSRVRPRQVLAVWAPVALFFAARAALDPRTGPLRAGGWMALGVLAWTLLEYVLHRWVFHFRPAPGSELQRDVAFLVHGVHHDWPHDPDRLVMPPVVAALIALAVGLPLRAAVGPSAFPGLFAGLVAGYLWYDLTHFAVHHLRQRTAFGKLQRRNHLVHHFAQPGARYGVTTPLWDVVFGTYPEVSGREVQGAAPRPTPGGETRVRELPMGITPSFSGRGGGAGGERRGSGSPRS